MSLEKRLSREELMRLARECILHGKYKLETTEQSHDIKRETPPLVIEKLPHESKAEYIKRTSKRQPGESKKQYLQRLARECILHSKTDFDRSELCGVYSYQ